MAFLVEAQPSQGYPQEGPEPKVFLPPDITPSQEIKANSFSYPLQVRIAEEWRPLLDANGEGSPSRRVDVFKGRVQRLRDITSGMSTPILDNPEGLDRDDILRYGNYLKIVAVDGATSLGIDVGSFIDKKIMEKMQEKYPADRVYALVREGRPPLEVMAALKYMHNNGISYDTFGQLPPISLPEWPQRKPRDPAFKDAFQDVIDIWQRRAFGIYLRPSERMPNVFGEAQEFIDEFEGMSESKLNGLARRGEFITSEQIPESQNDEKLQSIGSEAADVIIGWDGYASAIDDDQSESANETLDAMIERYKKTRRLVRLGMSEDGAMDLLREVDRRQRSGLRLPFVPIPAVAAVLFGG